MAWFGASAMASIPARLTLAAIKLDPASGFGRDTPQVTQFNVQSGNAVLLKCGDVISTPPPVWSFYK